MPGAPERPRPKKGALRRVPDVENTCEIEPSCPAVPRRDPEAGNHRNIHIL